VVELSSLKDSIVVTFSNKETKSYDFVIGADGIYSDLRKYVNSDVSIEEMDLTCWRGIFQRPGFLEQPQFFMGKDRFLLLHPIDEKRAYCGAISTVGGLPSFSPMGNFNQVYANFFTVIKGNLLAELDQGGGILERKVQHLSNVVWGDERLLLIGDAAHACAPSRQQGGSQALEDAVTLASLIDEFELKEVASKFKEKREQRVRFVFENSNLAAKAMVDVQESEVKLRNQLIMKDGLANFNLWKELFLSSPLGG
jgi:2-polyprenyl-6-methoxyphenol hydroxylase-like FAD-dependent oxidoreductase